MQYGEIPVSRNNILGKLQKNIEVIEKNTSQ